ncbi:complement factor H-like [Gracilinanus agilis]|uniref:complement factor H-like n=1 Tax=Gracilinanus agilis TaxID=191870 RepID=UPI001CFDC4BF|nr:complement factor H-like [Gracilinanus agilis]
MCYTGAAVVTKFATLWSASLPSNISTQGAELTALKHACIIVKDKRATIYTDSHYAFCICHAVGILWDQRGFLTPAGKCIANVNLINELLSALQLPEAIAVAHCSAYTHGGDTTIAMFIKQLQTKVREHHNSGAAVQACPIVFSLHNLNPGDSMYIKNFKRTWSPELSYDGPFQVEPAVHTLEAITVLSGAIHTLLTESRMPSGFRLSEAAGCAGTTQAVSGQNWEAAGLGEYRKTVVVAAMGTLAHADASEKCAEDKTQLVKFIYSSFFEHSSERGKPCEYPEIESGHLYKPYYQSEEYFRRSFPASIGRELDYHCDDHFVPAHGTNSYHSYWTRFNCTEEGWFPVPKCIRQCSIRSIPYGQFLPRKETFKEGEVITVKCHQGYNLQNNQDKITCTKQGWSIDPYCKKIKTCNLRTLFNNGFFSDSKVQYPVNTNANYQCKEGYATTNGKKEGFFTCGQNGWLGQPTCIKICNIPQFVNVKQKGNKTFLKPKERLEYECMDGYDFGNGQTTGFKICHDDEWPTVVECYEKACRLPILHEMEPDLKKEKYKVGDVLTFRCFPGFKIAGPSSVQCYNFGWSPRLPTCKQEVKCCEQPPEILNGTAKDPKKKEYCYDDVVEYDCDLGFVRRGPRKIQCNDGEWTTSPTCIEEKRRCAEVPELVHGYIQTTTDLSYSHGSLVEYGCVENFIMVGKKTSTCIHGNWTEPPTCIEKNRLGRCASKFFEDFQVNLKKEFNDIVINYKCNWNSEFKSTKCINGRWYPPLSCSTMKSCAPPPKIPNSQDMDITVNYKDGEKISIICKENYILQGQEEIICENGRWNSLPRCIEKLPCSKPPAIKYGDIKPVTTSELDKDNLEPSTYAHDTRVSYICQQGFIMIGEEEIKCNMGKWSSPPHCIGIPCGKPPQIRNGFIPKVSESYEFGEEVTYTCKEGYNIDGLATITCSGGTWSSPPQCKDVRCSRPPRFNNSDMLGTSKSFYMPGDKVVYHCLSNFQPKGSTEVICTGPNWKGDLQCIEEVGKCGPPPSINNGDIATFPLSEYAPESRVEYRCQKFYVLQGSQFVTCKKGIWTDPPRCFEGCTVSEEIMKRNNIQLRWKNTEKIYSRTGQETEFYCIWGYRRAEGSPPFRATCVEGKINYPICV